MERLTQRETEIFWLIGQGRTLRQIADSLKISVKTVEAHRSNIREKLRCRTAAEMVRVAGQWLSEQAEGDPSR